MRKLVPVIVAAMVVMGVSAASAQAAVEVRDGDTEQLCPDVEIDVRTVTGGCLVEGLEGPWEVWAGNMLIDVCSSEFDMRVDGEGNFYAVNTFASCGALARKACVDEGSSERVPWLGRLWGTPAMGMCIELSSGGSHIVAYMEFDLTLGPNGELLEMEQTNFSPAGAKNAVFTNPDTDAILVTTVP